MPRSAPRTKGVRWRPTMRESSIDDSLMRFHRALLTLVAIAACHHAPPASVASPLPAESPVRGDVAARRALGADAEQAIQAVIVQRFFRPSRGQARWIDPRPLGDARDARADSLAEPDDAWA